MSRHAVAAGGVAFLVYILSMPWGVAGGDSAELALGVYTQGIVHAPGYPLYLLLGRLFAAVPFPLIDFAGRVNLFSVICASLTVSLLVSLIRQITRATPAAATLAALLFAFAPRIWEYGRVAEVYALHTLLIVAVLLLALQDRPRPVLAAIFLGLALAHHPSAVLVAVVLAPYLLWQHRDQWMLILAPIVLIPVTFYLYLPLRAAADPAFNLLAWFERDITQPEDFFWMIRGGMFDERLFAYGPLGWTGEVLYFCAEWLRNFLLVGVVVGCIGVWHLWQRSQRLTLVLSGVFALQVAAFTSYDVFDKWSMFHTAYLVWAIFCAVGFQWLRYTRHQFNTLITGVGVLLIVLQIALGWRNFTPFERTYTTRSTATLLSFLPENALLIGDWQAIRPVEYVQIVTGTREDIRLYDYTLVSLALRDKPGLDGDILSEAARQAIFEQIDCAETPVYIVNPAVLQGRYQLTTITDRAHRVTPNSRYPCLR